MYVPYSQFTTSGKRGLTKRNTTIYVPMILRPFLLGPGRFFSFLILYTAGRTPWTGDQPIARPLFTQRTTQTQSKRTQTSMS
jgi:hypothetical protein